MIRVLVADDSPTTRRHITRMIEETPDMEVIGEARDGREAVQMVSNLRPDVVSMDISMPHMDGLAATRRIMFDHPTPVVVVSSLLDTDVELSLQALEAGALAVVGKPPDRHHESYEFKRQQLIKTLQAMARVRVISRRARRLIDGQELVEMPVVPIPEVPPPELLVIGASTGGPSALHRLLKELPADFKVPILVVQHMPNEFIAGLARWLSAITPLSVQIAGHQQTISRGQVFIAPGNAHLEVRKHGQRLLTWLDEAQGDYRYKPAVDRLFLSVAESIGASSIGLILTGMGDDGARGLLAMRQAGAMTFAQDEGSSIVFGMPNAAISNGAAVRVEGLSSLPTEILKLL